MALTQLVIILVAFAVMGIAMFIVVGAMIFNKKEKQSLRIIDLQVLATEYYGADFTFTKPDLGKTIELIETSSIKSENGMIDEIVSFRYAEHQVTVFEFTFKPDLDVSLNHLTGILLQCNNQKAPEFKVEKNGLLKRTQFDRSQIIPEDKLPNLGRNLISVYAKEVNVHAVGEFLKDKKRLLDLVWLGIEFHELYVDGQNILFYGEDLFDVESNYFDKVERIVKKLIQIFCPGEFPTV